MSQVDYTLKEAMEAVKIVRLIRELLSEPNTILTLQPEKDHPDTFQVGWGSGDNHDNAFYNYPAGQLRECLEYVAQFKVSHQN